MAEPELTPGARRILQVASELFYRHGYFRQSLSREGWQEETYPVLDPDGLPLTILRNPDGVHATVALALPASSPASVRPRTGRSHASSPPDARPAASNPTRSTSVTAARTPRRE